MKAERVLEIVVREMRAIGSGWRTSWVEFDGRYLRDQLDLIGNFAERALLSDTDIDYTEGTEFFNEQKS